MKRRIFMSRFKSIQTAYRCLKKKHIPFWVLDTNTLTVSYYNADTDKIEEKMYHSDSVKYHLSFSASKYPDRLRKLVNNGQIIAYLDDLEQKVADAIDRQVQLWKESDKEYIVTVENGDIHKAAQLENCLIYMARESVFEYMVYV